MRSAAPKLMTKGLEGPPSKPEPASFWSQDALYKLGLLLTAVALLYALSAGLRTVFDLDMGWHLATGRYVVLHHAIPSTDVLSYTSPGAEWLYPPFAGVLLYGIFQAGGYVGLSWFCALALMATVACLLRGPSKPEAAMAAALAIIAVPDLAMRATPRADLFTTVFFGVFVAQLWSFHNSGTDDSSGADVEPLRRTRARLWILPLVMVFWVNFHPGFIAGLGMLLAYLLVEAFELFFSKRRRAALQRMKCAALPLAVTVIATLLNPYGPKLFKASLQLAGFQPSAQPVDGPFVMELAGIPISPARLIQAMDWRNPSTSYWWIVFIALAVIASALWRRQLGAALITAVALYVGTQHLRFRALFEIIVVVVGSTILTEVLRPQRTKNLRFSAKKLHVLRLLPILAAMVLCLLTFVRISDVVSNRSYIRSSSESQFGAGESWWFPERAATFIQREHLPGNVFQLYNLGGFTAWRLGPSFRDFIDGRNVSPSVWAEQQELLSSPLDSAAWQSEADRRNINILFFSLARFYGLSDQNLMSLCQSQQWRPVYMDEVSIVLLRNRTENRRWIDQYGVDCQTHNFAPPVRASRGDLSNFDGNAGAILLVLGRKDEARQILTQGEAISPEDPTIHLALARFYDDQQQFEKAEQEFEAAVSIKRDDAVFWSEVGRFYESHGRYAEAREYVSTAAQLSLIPANEYTELGRIDLQLRNPQQALEDFARAEKALRGRENWDPNYFANIAEGRALAYFGMGERQRSIEFLQEALRRTPNNASRWQALGDLYDSAGQPQLAEQARDRSRALSQ